MLSVEVAALIRLSSKFSATSKIPASAISQCYKFYGIFGVPLILFRFQFLSTCPIRLGVPLRIAHGKQLSDSSFSFPSCKSQWKHQQPMQRYTFSSQEQGTGIGDPLLPWHAGYLVCRTSDSNPWPSGLIREVIAIGLSQQWINSIHHTCLTLVPLYPVKDTAYATS